MDYIKEAISAFGDKANVIWASLLTGVVALTIDYVLIFRTLGLFLLLNVVDYYYGRKKAKETNTLNSKVGSHGISKKVSYWVMIAISFCISSIMIDLAAQVGIDIGWFRLLSWFVLITYIMNEITSIVENLVILDYDVPDILVKGLSAMKSAIDSAGNKAIPGNKDGQSDDANQ